VGSSLSLMHVNQLETRAAGGPSTSTVHAWIVAARSAPIPTGISHRSGTSATKIKLAFPVTTVDLHPITEFRQQLFSWLPVRNYGLRFCIHADFELPASREDIATGRPWNDWLRYEVCWSSRHMCASCHFSRLGAVCTCSVIPQAVKFLCDTFVHISKFEPVKRTWFRWIPLPGAQ
jgi:hypothetical protein